MLKKIRRHSSFLGGRHGFNKCTDEDDDDYHQGDNVVDDEHEYRLHRFAVSDDRRPRSTSEPQKSSLFSDNFNMSFSKPDASNQDNDTIKDDTLSHHEERINQSQIAEPVVSSSGVKMLHIFRGGDSIFGLSCQNINGRLYVSFVSRNSAAARYGVRFGDELLSIDGTVVAGLGSMKTLKLLRQSEKDCHLKLIDRGLMTQVELYKENLDGLGFTFHNGIIQKVIKGTSAARSGMRRGMILCEINGICIVGLDDKDIQSRLQQATGCVYIHIMTHQNFYALTRKISGDAGMRHFRFNMHHGSL